MRSRLVHNNATLFSRGRKRYILLDSTLDGCHGNVCIKHDLDMVGEDIDHVDEKLGLEYVGAATKDRLSEKKVRRLAQE